MIGPQDGGVNNNVSPLLLPLNVMASSLNTTVRGSYVTQRSVFRKRTFTAEGLALINSAFLNGPYQGCCYFSPDTGNQGLLIAIGGRLFVLVPDPLSTTTTTVTEVTIPGDPMTASAPQIWMWQSELWVIVQDGVLNPCFYNTDSGVTTRSNYSNPVLFNTRVTTQYVTAAVGATNAGVVVTSTVGMVQGDILSMFSRGTFLVQTVVDGTHVDLVNLTGQPGQQVPANTLVTWQHIGVQLPPGRMGAYGIGRNAFSLIDGRQFVMSDAVGGSSGTQAFNYRDAVLNITENNYLAGGGNFIVPGGAGPTQAFKFTATLDASLGQGPLQVFTRNSVFSCQVPVDRLTWQDVTNPILTESLIANGSMSQNATFNVNGDLWFRSLDGIRSLVLGRRDFQTPGNVPQSQEIAPLLALDDPSLLDRASGCLFDNRLIITASPTTTSRGIVFKSLAVMNLDPLSTLRGKADPVYDALEWTGLNTFQLIEGVFEGTDKCFVPSYNAISDSFELWEILPTANTAYLDDDTIRIVWDFDTASLFKENAHVFKRLIDGEFYIDELQGQFDYQVWYRPDQYPCFTFWFSSTECQTQPTEGILPGFKPRLGLGEPPPSACDPSTNRPFRCGYTFDLRFIFTGKARFLGARFKAVEESEPQFAQPVCCPPIVKPEKPHGRPVLNDQTLCPCIAYPFSGNVSGSGGKQPFTFSTPNGITPGFTGAQVGPATFNISSALVPTVYGTSTFLLTATDSDGHSVTATISLVRIGPQGNYAGGKVGVAYSSGQADILLSGGVAPYTVTLSSGTLPPGLFLASDGTLSGTPTLAGTYDFFIAVSDSSGCGPCLTEMFSIISP